MAPAHIGHGESAAGIAGLTKILLQLRHQQLVPSLHAEQLNEHIDFAQTPFVVQRHLAPWVRPHKEGREYPRRAGLSSFGAGGSNAHLLVEEYEAVPFASHRPGISALATCILLSARDERGLYKRVDELDAFLQVQEVAMQALAYTLQVGREAMEERLAFHVQKCFYAT